ncbi:MAG TPA: SDR family NAD(P)-dependent oxidoreductase [Phototrophicaceae bacterium]|nr:SDR family NAD(P)-dependent oxidoreductase [Phototrophicaceae bacterium]
MNFLDFSNKTVLVTGAAGAIGKGVASGFASLGAKVFITDISEAALGAAEAEITGLGGVGCQSLPADVTQADQVKQVVQKAAAFFDNRFDVLVNVAGIVAQGKIEEISEAEWDRIFAVNCKGTFFFTRELVPYMKAQASGKIINYSSKSGKTGSALMSHYSAAKAAIIGFTQALAYELAEFNINVNCLCPGITENTGVWSHVSAGYVQNLQMPIDAVVKKFSAKVPLGRLASIDDIVATTLFLASTGADYMTGQAINVTGGREMH